MKFLSLSKSLHWIVIAFPAIITLVFFPFAAVSLAQSKMVLIVVFVLVTLTGFLVSRYTEPIIRIPRSALLFVAGCIPLVYIISALWTGAPGSLWGAGSELDTVAGIVLAYACALCTALVVRTDDRVVHATLSSLVIGSVGVAGVYLVQLIMRGSSWLPAISLSAVGSWHEAAIIIALGALILLQRFIRGGGVGNAALLVFSFGILVILGSFDAWIGIAVAAFFLLILRVFRRRAHDALIFEKGFFLYSGIIALALTCAFFASSLRELLPEQLRVDAVEVRPSWQGTYEVGQRVFAQRDTLFLGSGPNTFAHQWGLYKPLSVNATDFWNADFPFGIGFVPTTAITVGIPVLIMWCGVFFFLLYELYVRVRAREDEGSLDITLLIALIFIAVYLVIYVPGLALVALFFSLLGVCASRNPSHMVYTLTRSQSHTPLVLSIAALFLVGLVGISFGTVRALASNVMVNNATITFQKTGSTARAAENINTALALLPSNDRAHRSAIELGLIQFAEAARSTPGNTSALQDILSNTIQHGLSAVAGDPSKYDNWLALAQFYRSLAGAGIEGADAQAKASFIKAAETRPNNPYPLISLAEISIAENDASSTRAYLEKALQVKPNFALGHYLISRLNVTEGKYEAAVESAVAVAQLAPQDPLSWFHLGSLLYAGRDMQNAEQSLLRALQLEENYADARFVLALVYANSDRRDEAKLELERVLALNPGNPAVLQALAELQKTKTIRNR